MSELSHYAQEMDYSRYDHMTLEALVNGKEELQGAISNEKAFQRGCSTFDDIWMHEYNISALLQELEYVEARIRTMTDEQEVGGKGITGSTLDAKIQNASSRVAGTRIASQVKEKEPDI